MSIQTTFLSAMVVLAAVSSALAANELPMRATPIPETTNGVPHVQIGVEPEPEISEALLDRVAMIPGVDIRNTVISLPGALGFWIKEDVTVARPEVIVGGREFAHIHPDGSLHASLPPVLARQAVEAGWAVSHPWANQRPGWEGLVMIFTPTNTEELDVVLDLVQASYDFVTRQD
ncbi:luciferase family protein [uncultured Roseibium sp.]|uniref:luciferase domain-containing protein n=1 Tax=uncultured Roseibium sp. TaxID=1936171 RepID=UPI002623FF08|nr:luciferase family protein [uncultured Roseibium sp.]